MQAKLVNGSVVLAAAILAVVFLLRPWEKEVSSDQFVVHRREKRDLDPTEPASERSQTDNGDCTNGTNCFQGGVNKTFNSEEGRKLCHQNTSDDFRLNCSGQLLNFSDYCAKLDDVSSNDTLYNSNCSKVLGVVQHASVNNTNTSAVVVRLLVSPSEVLKVSLATSVKSTEAANSIFIQVHPNKTVSILPKGTPALVANSSADSVLPASDVSPSSTVHIGVPASSSVEVKLVAATEEAALTTATVPKTTLGEHTEMETKQHAETEIPKVSTDKTTGTQNEPDTTQPHPTTEMSEHMKETTIKTTIHIIKNTMQSPYEEEEQSVRFFMSNVMMPVSCGVGAAVIIALAFFMYRRCRRRKLKRVRYFGNRPGEKQFLDRMKLLEDSSEEE